MSVGPVEVSEIAGEVRSDLNDIEALVRGLRDQKMFSEAFVERVIKDIMEEVKPILENALGAVADEGNSEAKDELDRIANDLDQADLTLAELDSYEAPVRQRPPLNLTGAQVERWYRESGMANPWVNIAEEINRLDAQRLEEYERIDGDGDGDLTPTQQVMAEIHAELRR